jgi:protein ImuB
VTYEVSRRYLAVFLPLLPSERITMKGAPPDGPFALVEKQRGAMRIMALDQAALALGLTPGLTLADARARVPELVVFDHDPCADAALLDWLAEACDRYTPMVAIDPPHGLILDITGCTHPFVRPKGSKKVLHAKARRREGEGALRAFAPSRENPFFDAALPEARLAGDLITRLRYIGFSSRTALASTPDAASALAQFGSDDATGLPVEALRVESDMHVALRRAGLRQIGDVASLPPAPLAARFGAALPVMLDRLLGREDVRITPRRTPADIETEARFAEPVARTDDVLAIVARLIGEAAIALSERGTGGRAFGIALYRSDGNVARLSVETAQPVRDPKVLDRLFRERINTLADPLDPGFGYDLIRLHVLATEAMAPEQLRLDGGRLADAELAALIDRLSVRLGRGRVRRFAAVDTHIPEQSTLELPVAAARPSGHWPAPEPGEPPLRPIHLFDPPHRIDVTAEVPDGPPRRFKWRRTLHEVSKVEGPERIAAEWWMRRDNAGLTRDYYRVEDVRGRRYWLFRHGLYGMEKTHPDWYLHGLFA